MCNRGELRYIPLGTFYSAESAALAYARSEYGRADATSIMQAAQQQQQQQQQQHAASGLCLASCDLRGSWSWSADCGVCALPRVWGGGRPHCGFRRGLIPCARGRGRARSTHT